MKTYIRLLSALLALLLCLSLLPLGTMASEEPAGEETLTTEEAPPAPEEPQESEAAEEGEEAPPAEETPAPPEEPDAGEEVSPALDGDAEETAFGEYEDEGIVYAEGDDNDELFAAYVDRVFAAGGDPMALDGAVKNTGGYLTGVTARLYELIAPMIRAVAAGERSDTQFVISIGDVLGRTQYTAAELGLPYCVYNGKITTEAQNAYVALLDFDLRLLMNSILADYPYELYWFDKTSGMGYSRSLGFSANTNSITGSGTLTLRLSVSSEYALETYSFDTSVGTAVRTSASNAQAIVTRYAGLNDYGKLCAYRDEICALTAYNYDAADESTNTPYGNPWQLIWIFDGDPDTKVVCEGYSKGFQYLCDLSTFRNPICCYCATGAMNGGAHMWNIVTMDDGLNYLVDITNCDSGTVGYPDLLFLRGYAAQISGGYRYSCGGYSINYVYDSDLTSLFTAADLALSATDYQVGVPVSADVFPDAAFLGYVSNRFDLDNDGVLSEDECAAVVTLNVSALGLSSLDGLESFPALEELCCDRVKLTSLDVSGNPALTALSCQSCGLTSLDLSGNPLLEELNVKGNTLVNVDIRQNPLLVAVARNGEKRNEGGALLYGSYNAQGQFEPKLVYDEWRPLAIDHIPGDVNGDDVRNSLDTASLMRYFAGSTASAVAIALDINGDGRTNSLDTACLMRFMAGTNVRVY